MRNLALMCVLAGAVLLVTAVRADIRKLPWEENLRFATVTIDRVKFNHDTTELILYPNYVHEDTSYTIPNSVTSIGKGAFYRCNNLKSVTIPNSVTSIGDDAFGFANLTSVTIPGSVTSIGVGAFYDCDDLTSVTILDGVMTIGKGAFIGSGLTSITIPNSVTVIGETAFTHCADLESITISENVTTIGGTAFYGCPLRSITVKNPTPPVLGDSSVFTSYPCLYVPKGSRAAYRAAEGWKVFGCIKEIDDGLTGVRITVAFLAALVLSAAVFVIIRKSRIHQGKECQK